MGVKTSIAFWAIITIANIWMAVGETLFANIWLGVAFFVWVRSLFDRTHDIYEEMVEEEDTAKY